MEAEVYLKISQEALLTCVVAGLARAHVLAGVGDGVGAREEGHAKVDLPHGDARLLHDLCGLALNICRNQRAHRG